MDKKRNKTLMITIPLFLILIAAKIFLPGTLNRFYQKQDIKRTIREYYDTSFDMYLNLKIEGLTHLVDMDSIQMKNYATALDRTINWWIWDLKISGSEDTRKKLPISFDFKDISINGDTAVATVYLDGDREESYPPFVSFDENIFILNIKETVWLISEHDYQYYSEGLYERSKTELFTYNLNELIKEIEKDYDPNTAPE